MKVQGNYYGHPFTGTVETELPHQRIINLFVKLDKEINHFGIRKSLLLSNWRNGKDFSWGSCFVIEEK